VGIIWSPSTQRTVRTGEIFKPAVTTKNRYQVLEVTDEEPEYQSKVLPTDEREYQSKVIPEYQSNVIRASERRWTKMKTESPMYHQDDEDLQKGKVAGFTGTLHQRAPPRKKRPGENADVRGKFREHFSGRSGNPEEVRRRPGKNKTRRENFYARSGGPEEVRRSGGGPEKVRRSGEGLEVRRRSRDPEEVRRRSGDVRGTKKTRRVNFSSRSRVPEVRRRSGDPEKVRRCGEGPETSGEKITPASTPNMRKTHVDRTIWGLSGFPYVIQVRT
jgi:hypothetical protein